MADGQAFMLLKEKPTEAFLPRSVWSRINSPTIQARHKLARMRKEGQEVKWGGGVIELEEVVKKWREELSSVQSLDRVGPFGNMMDDSAEILFQSFLQEARVSSSGIGRDVQSLMLPIQH